mgnify:CR=1 FL=1
MKNQKRGFVGVPRRDSPVILSVALGFQMKARAAQRTVQAGNFLMIMLLISLLFQPTQSLLQKITLLSAEILQNLKHYIQTIQRYLATLILA